MKTTGLLLSLLSFCSASEFFYVICSIGYKDSVFNQYSIDIDKVLEILPPGYYEKLTENEGYDVPLNEDGSVRYSPDEFYWEMHVEQVMKIYEACKALLMERQKLFVDRQLTITSMSVAPDNSKDRFVMGYKEVSNEVVLMNNPETVSQLGDLLG